MSVENQPRCRRIDGGGAGRRADGNDTRIVSSSGWSAGGTCTEVYSYDFYPREEDLVAVSPKSTVRLTWNSEFLREHKSGKAQYSLTYRNNAGKYFAKEKGRLILKSDKKIFRGIIGATFYLR